MIRALIIALAALLLCSWGACGPDYRQAAADAKAGVEAGRQEPDPVKRAAIYAALADYVWSLLSQIPDLPPPTSSPSEIRADVEDYAEAGAALAADPPAQQPLTTVDPAPSIADDLRSTGTSLWSWAAPIGGIFGGLALLLLLVSWTGWTGGGWILRLLMSPVLRPLINLVALWSAGVTTVAAAARWLADWLWLVGLVVTVAVGILAWVHWRQIVAWWRKRRAVRP